MIFISFLLALLLFQSSSASQLYSSGLVGCYINNREQHEFNEFAGHLDPATLTPQRCMKACSSMAFNFAAIEEGRWCFCKSGAVNSVPSAGNCETIVCQGDNNFFCGGQNHLLVYDTRFSSPIHASSLYILILFYLALNESLYLLDPSREPTWKPGLCRFTFHSQLQA